MNNETSDIQKDRELYEEVCNTSIQEIMERPLD